MLDVEQPFDVTATGSAYDVVAHVQGGGLSGQAGAIRLGISRALAKISEEYRKQLRKKGFMTRDSRIVERKKYGQAGARKRFQFSKR
jgi:small subunit ribosomal protein S9